jgi:hypothetical protein
MDDGDGLCRQLPCAWHAAECLKPLFTLSMLKQIFWTIESNCIYFFSKLETGRPVNQPYKPEWVVRTGDELLALIIAGATS